MGERGIGKGPRARIQTRDPHSAMALCVGKLNHKAISPSLFVHLYNKICKAFIYLPNLCMGYQGHLCMPVSYTAGARAVSAFQGEAGAEPKIYVPTLTYGHELWVMTDRMR